MATTPWYATREDVMSALDVAETARTIGQVDRLCDAASRQVEALCRRRFYPTNATRYFDWPNHNSGRGWVLWLDADELISVTSLLSAGSTIASTDYFLEPNRSGPPYNRIEIDLSSSASFGGGATHQRDLAITGVWGASNDETSVGTTAEALDDSETLVDVTDSAAVGVGSLLRVENERMVVTGKRSLTTGQTINGALTAAKSDVTVQADDGSTFFVGETILIDSEKMLITDIVSNNLIVLRAWAGSTLAAHSIGATVYAPRTLQVTRGAVGTVAASHLTSATIYRSDPPPLVKAMTVAEAVFTLQNEQSGYGRTVGLDESGGRSVQWQTVRLLREQVVAAHGRQARFRSV